MSVAYRVISLRANTKRHSADPEQVVEALAKALRLWTARARSQVHAKRAPSIDARRPGGYLNRLGVCCSEFYCFRGVLVFASTLALAACAADGSSPGDSVEDETGPAAQQETWDLGEDFSCAPSERFVSTCTRAPSATKQAQGTGCPSL